MSALIEEVYLSATQWLWTYNNERPKMALGAITPAMKLAEAFDYNPLLQASVKKWELQGNV